MSHSPPSPAERPLRILQVSARFRPYVGGTEIHTGEVARELTRRGHHVTVLTTDLGGHLPAEEVDDGVRVVRVRAWPRRLDLYLAPRLGRLIAQEPWDMVHVQGYHTAVAPLALMAAQRRHIPTALTFHSGGHSSRLRNLARPFHARAMARLLRRCELLIGVSDFEAELFAGRLGLDPGRIRTIPNGVSSRRSATANRSSSGDGAPLDSDQRGPHLLSIGRLQRYKGHQRLIRAMPKILAAHPRARLTVIGTGPDEARLARLVRRLGLGDHVAFDSVGADDRHRLDEIMASASAAVFLSEYESHGMAAHEALLAGLPIVVLDATALGRLAADGLADAVPPMATDAEVAAIVGRTLRSVAATGDDDTTPAAPTAPAADQLDRLRHSWSTIAARLERAYREVIPVQVDERPAVHPRAG